MAPASVARTSSWPVRSVPALHETARAVVHQAQSQWPGEIAHKGEEAKVAALVGEQQQEINDSVATWRTPLAGGDVVSRIGKVKGDCT